MEVVAAQDVAKELGVLEKMTFRETFDSVRESGSVYNDWKARFDAQDNTKTLSVLLDTGTTTGGEDEMVVDEGSVVGTNTRGARRQTRNASTIEVTISKAPTPVSSRTFGFD